MANTLEIASDDGWIQTFTGKAFWPLNPKVVDVCIEDIAHALALKCRYTGHCRHFYSVAQHSYLCSTMVGAEEALWGLLHDAAEAYLPDVARPVKSRLKGFRAIEDRVLEVIAESFGLTMPIPPSVYDADLSLLTMEKRDLMAAEPFRWTSIDGVFVPPGRINPCSWQVAEEDFLARFHELKK